MAACLIALGSNLGDRADQLRRAVGQLARLPQSQLVARSAWRETPPIGGPAGQGPFLNGAALLATLLAPETLLSELQRIEEHLGRSRAERWDARTIDLDLLLYDRLVQSGAALVVPHPRMGYRRFVLTPAAEVAPWMVDPDSGWTIAALLDLLDRGADQVAVAATDASIAEHLIEQLPLLWPASVPAPKIVRWQCDRLAAVASNFRPKLILAILPDPGSDRRHWRKMLHLPARGPVAWIAADGDDVLREAQAAMESVWHEGKSQQQLMPPN